MGQQQTTTFTFDQQAFMEAIGIATATIVEASNVVATIAHASATGGRGGSSNLYIFTAHHPPTFKRVRDLMVANHWFRQVGKVLKAIEVTFDATKVKLVTFQLEGESQVVGLSQSLKEFGANDMGRVP